MYVQMFDYLQMEKTLPPVVQMINIESIEHNCKISKKFNSPLNLTFNSNNYFLGQFHCFIIICKV